MACCLFALPDSTHVAGSSSLDRIAFSSLVFHFLTGFYIVVNIIVEDLSKSKSAKGVFGETNLPLLFHHRKLQQTR